jgi:hypothetical protein
VAPSSNLQCYGDYLLLGQQEPQAKQVAMSSSKFGLNEVQTYDAYEYFHAFYGPIVLEWTVSSFYGLLGLMNQLM